MKTKLFYWATLSAVLLASCTDNEMREDNGKPQLEKNAYASVVIKLPSTSDNKTKAEPGTEDGDADEFKVKDLTLLFFSVPAGQEEEKIAESDFILSEVVSTEASLSTGSVLPESVIQGNTKTLSTGPISINDKSVRVLAVLNVGPTEGVAKELLKLGSPFSTINRELPIPGGDLNALLGKDKDCFLMTSAPVYSGSDMKTLTECITSTNETNAQNNITTISVERVVAKVDLKTNDDTYKQDPIDKDLLCFTVPDGQSHSGDRITILAWALGNTNNSAFPFRKVNPVWASDNAYKTLWDNAISPSKSRIYWAVDPNYEQLASADKFLTPTKIDNFIDQPTKAVEYCLENTSHYSMMLKSQTTRLIVKAKYIPDDTKITVSSGNNTVDTDGTWWSFTTVAEHYSVENMYRNIIKWIHDNLNTAANDMPDVPTDATGITYSVGQNKELIGVTQGRNWSITLEPTTDSHYKLAKVTYFTKANNTLKELTGDALAGFHSSKGEVQQYKEGVCYYEIFIRHFTDEEGGYGSASAPWIKEGDYKEPQLGRYGVVRNNWYTVTINSIKQPGEPTIPVDGDEPVDAATAYIDCSIEITPWARRNHSVDL